MQSPGNLFIVAAPSGGGKTSLVKQLVTELPNIEVSVSHTTRSKRPSEEQGVSYFFVSEREFFEMVEQSLFVEHARVFDHFYGTSIAQINQRLTQGLDVVLDIDWQGAQQIKQVFSNAIGVFIIPPSMEALQQRLTHRREDKPEVIEQRMNRARDELSHYADFDYLIVNDNFDEALAELKAIVIATRLTMTRQIQQQRKLLSFLLTSQ